VKLTVLLLCALIAACANVPLTATQETHPTATIAVLPARLIARVTATPTIAVHQCAVSAEVLTVRDCAGVQCAAIDWLEQGEIVTTTQQISGWVWTGKGFINSKFCEEVK
jgi:hypothetical protein